jgi:hypothetical protein
MKKKVIKKMRYECPQCKSMRKPRIINYFPPVTVRCVDCRKEGLEKKFIKEEQTDFKTIPHIH